MGQRVSQVGAEVVFKAVEESATEHTRQINALLASLAERTTLYSERFYLPGAGTLQPLDEWGNPLPVREEGYYDVAYPIQGGGTAWGDNRITRALMQVEEANRYTLESLKRDADWLRRHVMAALFDNVAWTFDDQLHGNITIQPLANNDAVVYTRTGGTTSTDNHYLAQAAAIADAADPFDDIYSELMEHPSNDGPVVVYVPTDLVSSIEALTAFIEIGDPDLIYGASVTQVEADETLLDEIRGPGDEVHGKVDKCWIVEWRALPDNYMIAHARGGGPVLRMREYEAVALQGFFPERFSPDGNTLVTRMLRYAGFGVVNRIGALAYRIGNASYGIPTGYDAPLAV